MSINQSIKERLRWLLDNAKRLNWCDESSPYRELYLVLERVLMNDEFGSDREKLSMWTSSRVSEGFSHQLKPFNENPDSPFSSWETVAEIHTSLRQNS